ncbi:TPA: ATP-dependent RNA helicase RhlE, partial [Aeromonas salmonicida subsp. salmonicida]
GHANAKHNAKAPAKGSKGKPKADGSKQPAPARQKDRGGVDAGLTPMRRLPRAQRDSYQDNSNEE